MAKYQLYADGAGYGDVALLCNTDSEMMVAFALFLIITRYSGKHNFKLELDSKPDSVTIEVR